MKEHIQHNHHTQSNLKSMAFMATAHCLTGCAIGEVLGLVIGTALGWTDFQTIVLAVSLAFLFGYSLTLFPLIKGGMQIKQALSLAFASDTISITVMEIVDNSVMLLIPGAMHAHVTSFYFWLSMLIALVVAFIFAYPVNMYLISKGKGHAVMHGHH
jgi:hypothetical protein